MNKFELHSQSRSSENHRHLFTNTSMYLQPDRSFGVLPRITRFQNDTVASDYLPSSGKSVSSMYIPMMRCHMMKMLIEHASRPHLPAYCSDDPPDFDTMSESLIRSFPLLILGAAPEMFLQRPRSLSDSPQAPVASVLENLKTAPRSTPRPTSRYWLRYTSVERIRYLIFCEYM